MEKEDRVKRYLAGESVSSLARDYDVTRQAIICYLKKAGVHGKRVHVKDVKVEDYSVRGYGVEEGGSDGGICNVLGCEVTETLFEPVLKRLKVGVNVYRTPKGIEVFDISKGGLKTHKTFVDLMKVYG